MALKTRESEEPFECMMIIGSREDTEKSLMGAGAISRCFLFFCFVFFFYQAASARRGLFPKCVQRGCTRAPWWCARLSRPWPHRASPTAGHTGVSQTTHIGTKFSSVGPSEARVAGKDPVVSDREGVFEEAMFVPVLTELPGIACSLSRVDGSKDLP